MLVGAQFPRWAGLPIEPVDSSGTVRSDPELSEPIREQQRKLQARALEFAKFRREQRGLGLLPTSAE